MPHDVKIDPKKASWDAEIKRIQEKIDSVAKGFNNAMNQTQKQRQWASQKQAGGIPLHNGVSVPAQGKKEYGDFDLSIKRLEISPGIYSYILYANYQSLGIACRDRLQLLESMQEYMDSFYGDEEF